MHNKLQWIQDVVKYPSHFLGNCSALFNVVSLNYTMWPKSANQLDLGGYCSSVWILCNIPVPDWSCVSYFGSEITWVDVISLIRLMLPFSAVYSLWVVDYFSHIVKIPWKLRIVISSHIVYLIQISVDRVNYVMTIYVDSELV